VYSACGNGIKGACTKGSECTPGVPGVCLPLLDRRMNNTAEVIEVTGIGLPAERDCPCPPVPAFTICKNADFSGGCITYSLCSNFCAELTAEWKNVISSVRIEESAIGCNFWVATNCVGDGIRIDSGAIFNLAATNYNDRLVAFNCYLH
ncbi:hypothetical protein MPER_01555, partial [Moniliophthora perniciosa FA553]